MKDDDPILLPEDIADIIAILDGALYDRIDIKTTRFTLRVARSGSGWTQSWEHTAIGPEVESVVAPSADLKKVTAFVEKKGIFAVRSPLPGTFYRAPRPGAPAFVEMGDSVDANTVVGIIETMKLMNSVPAGVTGEIIEIIAENGTLVELNGILMRVRVQTDGK
jgi:acetyl-CoA carboxylase biotin carboxyl carrier protein